MKHDTFITLSWRLERKPPRFEDNEVKYPESLVRHFLKQHTRPGDKVFDPFAGLGTTLFVAEKMRRVPFGIEADDRRHPWVAGQINNWSHLIHGDAARMLSYGLPLMDFAMTSPPYMPNHHKWNPLYGGDPHHAGYDTYLRRMTHIFDRLSKLMKRNAIIVVQADNLQGRRFTPLVRDIGGAVSKALRPEGETVVSWSNRRAGELRHTHCLIFRNARAS